MKGIIYKYTFPNRKVYIGQTRRHPGIRKREHLDKVVGPTNSAFWKAYQKYGEPEYEEIVVIEDDNIDRLVYRLNILESSAIQQYKATNPEFGYNIETLGHAHTDALPILRKKMEELFNKEIDFRLKTYNSLYDKILNSKGIITEDELYLVKKKYREENPFQGRIDGYNFDQLNKNSEEMTEFIIDDALPFIKYAIIEELKKDICSYINENAKSIISEERKNKAIVQIDKEGNVIKEYSSVLDICQAFNIERGDNIRNVLKGKQKTAYGYYWKYSRDLEKE